jgi:hypothetical protein
MKAQKTQAKAILIKKTSAGDITIPDFKLYYRTIVAKTAWYWHKNRYVNQWNRIADPEISSHNYSHQTFNKGAKSLC